MTNTRVRRRVPAGRTGVRTVIASLLAATTALAGGAAGASAATRTVTVTFTTAGCSTWSVPAGTESVDIRATGAAGGQSSDYWMGGSGGRGDQVQATLSGSPVAAGQMLYVCVDQGGGWGIGTAGDGGGASGVSLGSDFTKPVVVAAGGGGGGASGNFNRNGGDGGDAGMAGANSASNPTAKGGAAGTLTGGGAGGSGATVGGAPTQAGNGSLFSAAGPGSGGNGDTDSPWAAWGGGGGAGYAGGGGGGAAMQGPDPGGAGGGGGADFCGLSVTYPGGTSIANCAITPGAGTQTGAGVSAGFAQVTISYLDMTPPTTSATPAPGSLPKGLPLVSVSGTATVKNQGGTTLGTQAFSCFDTRGLDVTMAATDNSGGSGVASLTYAATGAQPIASTTVNASTARVSITAPGVTTLTYAATDVAGNQETTHAETVIVGRGFSCAGPKSSISPPQHGSLVVTGTATADGHSYPFSQTIPF